MDLKQPPTGLKPGRLDSAVWIFSCQEHYPKKKMTFSPRNVNKCCLY